MTTDKTIFFKRIEALCHERNMNVSDLETAAGIGAGTIPGWRKGSKPRLTTIIKLAEFFNVSRAYLEGETDDPIDYANIDTSEFNSQRYDHFLKKCKGNVAQANREYLEFEKQEAQDALSERPAVFHNSGDNYGLIGNAHAPVKIINGSEHTLSDHESEILRIFSELSLIDQSKVLVYAAELRDKKGKV